MVSGFLRGVEERGSYLCSLHRDGMERGILVDNNGMKGKRPNNE